MSVSDLEAAWLAAFPRYTTDGVASSGPGRPNKVLVRQLGQKIADAITTSSGGGGALVYATVANLNADLAHDANTMAWVVADLGGDVANKNGIWRKNGASGTGSWTWLRKLNDVELGIRLTALEGVDAENRLSALEGDADILTAYRREMLERPGDATQLFADSYGGAPEASVGTIRSPVISANGKVLQISGAGVLARRGWMRIELGRKYLVRAVMQRATDPVDPNNDAIQFGVAWFTNSGGQVVGAPVSVVGTFSALTVESGRTQKEAIIGLAPGDDITNVAPGTTVYARPYVQSYGAGGVTSIEVLSIKDVTDSIGDAIASGLVDDAIAAAAQVASIETNVQNLRDDAAASAASAGADMWSRPVDSIEMEEPESPSLQDRVLLDETNAVHPNQIAEYFADGWKYSGPPATGQIISVGEEPYKFKSDAWSLPFIRAGLGAIARSQSQINATIAATPYDYGFVNGGASATAKFQALLDAEDAVYLPSGNYELDGTLAITRPGQRFHGPGALKFLSGVAHSYGIHIQTNDVTLSGLKVLNPNLLGGQTGGATFGIYNEGHRNTFLNLYCEDWEHGIATTAYGEWYDTIYAFCRTRILGRGDGPDDAASAYGEDRGDGITDWGGRGKILFCTAQAKAGTDCRSGHFIENLPLYAADASGAEFAAGAMIIGCTAIPSDDGTGRIRRGHAIEGIDRVIVSHNYARGSTWQNFQIGTPKHALITHNISVNDLDPADQCGAAWSPVRSGYILYLNPPGVPEDVHFEGNIHVGSTIAMQGYTLQGNNGTIGAPIAFRGNSAITTVDMTAIGSAAYSATDVASGSVLFEGNRAYGDWLNGIAALNVDRVVSRDNEVDGPTDFGIVATSGCNIVESTNDQICNTGAGMHVAGFDRAIVRGLVTRNVTAPEISHGGSGGHLIIQGPIDHEGTGVVSSYGTNKVRYVGEAVGYTSDQRGAATDITDKTSLLNTWGKHAGLLVVDANNIVWVALGATATDQWKKIEDGTTITPA